MGKIHRGTAPSQRGPLRAAAAHESDLEVGVGGVLWELIPAGLYDAIGIDWRRLAVFKTTKLAIEFDVLVSDSAVEFGVRKVRLSRFYNIRSGPERRVLASPRGDFLREWTLIAGRRPSRHDRLSPRVFVGTLCAVEVDTVTIDHRQHALADLLQYSKIARIIERKAGGGAL